MRNGYELYKKLLAKIKIKSTLHTSCVKLLWMFVLDLSIFDFRFSLGTQSMSVRSTYTPQHSTFYVPCVQRTPIMTTHDAQPSTTIHRVYFMYCRYIWKLWAYLKCHYVTAINFAPSGVVLHFLGVIPKVVWFTCNLLLLHKIKRSLRNVIEAFVSCYSPRLPSDIYKGSLESLGFQLILLSWLWPHLSVMPIFLVTLFVSVCMLFLFWCSAENR